MENVAWIMENIDNFQFLPFQKQYGFNFKSKFYVPEIPQSINHDFFRETFHKSSLSPDTHLQRRPWILFEFWERYLQNWVKPSSKHEQVFTFFRVKLKFTWEKDCLDQKMKKLLLLISSSEFLEIHKIWVKDKKPKAAFTRFGACSV